MPVSTINHCIRILHPIEENLSRGHRLLYKILAYYNEAPNNRNEKHYQLLCKALFHSYDVHSKIVNEDVLREYFNHNGFSLSLDPEVLQMKHQRFDGIERITIICHGAGIRTKIIAFPRHKSGRKFKYGYRP